MEKSYYTIWHWSDCPSNIKWKTTLDSGTWVVKYPVGYSFPFEEINLSEHPEYEIDLVKEGAHNIMFIKDPENADYIFVSDYDISKTSTSFPVSLNDLSLSDISLKDTSRGSNYKS